MRAVILYHPKSDLVGMVEEYSHDFIRFKSRALELISLETLEGAEMAKLYDITSYPAILVIGPEGQLMQVWQNGVFPLMDQLAAYLGDPTESVSHEARILKPIHQLNPV